MTNEQKAKVRAEVEEEWRHRLEDAERPKLANPFDFVTLGVYVAKAMNAHKDEIEGDIAAEIRDAEAEEAEGRD
jgi:hypothetical protein